VGEVANGNRIWIKRECDNPFGSHYDRVYIALFRHYEELDKIKPGDKVLETTSGAAGVSFAGLGKILGYDCYVALPAGGEKAREKAILQQLKDESHLTLTPAEKYIAGFPEYLRKFLAEHKDYFFLNHSMGSWNPKTREYNNNEVTLKALEAISKEVACIVVPDYFVPAVGNGSSMLGVGRALDRKTKIVAFETFQSAVMYSLLYPGEYEKKFGIKPGTLSRHKLPGTSYPGIAFPHIKNAVREGLVNKVVLVSDKSMDAEYEKLTGRKDTVSLPHWDRPDLVGVEDLGRSTRAGIAVALDLAKTVKDKDMLVIAYDKAERYDD